MLAPLLLTSLLGCNGTQDGDPLATLDDRYSEISRDLAIADRDTARNVRNTEARARKVRHEQERVAFFSDPKVIATIEAARESADPAVAAKADAYWRHAVYIRSWTEQEKARETELLAAIEEQRTREALWQTPDGDVEISLNGRWPHVSQEADALTPERRAELLDAWVDHRTSWLGDDLIALVQLRNEVARREGFDSYWDLAVTHRGLDPADVRAMLDELEALVTPIHQASTERLRAEAETAGLALDFANTPLLLRQAGLELKHDEADAWFDTELAEQRMAEAFTDLGISIEGLQIYVGPSRYTRPGAYGFIIRPPEHGAVVVSNDTRWAMWPYRALTHEIGRATWWRNLQPEMASSPVTWEPAAPWYEGYGQVFERMLFEPSFLERYVPELPAEHRETLRAYRVQNTVDTLTWYVLATRFEEALYDNPHDLPALCAHAAAREKALRAWPYDGPKSSDGHLWSSSYQSGLMLNYPGYVQNFLFASATEATLWEVLSAQVGDPVGNPKVGPWLVENLVHTVNPTDSFSDRLKALSGDAPRTAALARYVGR
ncbi:MAG: hypothetical protein H6739_15520 [Alphaproteobacteria bacterium]|nr:hypothetical protein [Alphaproteobacteria bacterium]